MNAIGDIRVSTTGQADDGVSLDAQRERINAWCLLNGYTLAAVHVDAGISGKRSDNRPALQAALDAVCSTKDTLTIADRLERAGADLASLSEKIDTTSAAGKMVFRMLAVLAEFERDLVSERTTVAMQHKRNQGERVGTVPYGFELCDDGVQLRRNDDEQRVLELINELRADGFTLRAIAAELNRRGITTKKGNNVWKVSSVQRILARAA